MALATAQPRCGVHAPGLQRLRSTRSVHQTPACRPQQLKVFCAKGKRRMMKAKNADRQRQGIELSLVSLNRGQCCFDALGHLTASCLCFATAEELKNLDAEEKRMQEIALKTAKGKVAAVAEEQEESATPSAPEVVEYAALPEEPASAPQPTAPQPVPQKKTPLDTWFENLDTNTKLYILLFGYGSA